ncbi:MAG: archaemetzincin family Zn-dependent metalloprotease [Thermoleophilia bacterium]|nr:archaemetzincin family Zn-dependent metalloprotease [Thermoleophilia bacterium]
MKPELLIIPLRDLYDGGSDASSGEVDGLLAQLAVVAGAAFGYAPVSRESIAGALPLPAGAYNSRRGQYDAGGLLEALAKRSDGEALILGVTAVDLFAPRLNFVFGLSDRNTGTAVISLHRLAPEFYHEEPDTDLFKERVGKEAIHELGHLLGLSHCTNAGCIMRFSSTIAETDEKGPGFCESCEPTSFR